jgi:hypothetical protein
MGFIDDILGIKPTKAEIKQTVFTHTDLGVDQITFNNISNSCNMTGTANNLIEIIGSDNVKLDAKQTNELQQMCKLNTVLTQHKDAKSAIDLFSKLSGDAEGKGGFPLAGANSSVNQDIRHQMSSKLKQEDHAAILQKCTQTSGTDNIIKIIASRNIDATINQANKAMNECILDAANQNNITASAAAKTADEAQGKSKASGMTFASMFGLESLYSTLGTMGAAGPVMSGIVSIVLCLICLGFCVLLFKGGSSSSPSTPSPVATGYTGYTGYSTVPSTAQMGGWSLL